APPAGGAARPPPAAPEGDGPVEIAESAAPGQNVRLPGHDLAAGARLAAAGATVDADLALACRLAGLTRLDIRAPAIHVAPHDDPAADWLAAGLAALGVRLVTQAGAAHLTIDWDADTPPRLALAPGGATSATRRAGQVALTLAPRFDAALGALCGLIWPILARLAGRRLAAIERPLAAKLVSTIGVTDLALLAASPTGWRPLAVGQATLETLLAADAVALLGPACEGLPTGAPLAAFRLDAPFAETSE
ncbi:MAG: hypothetical protein JNK46_03580, partial [Methylobacteriaceae bacterium]|nr:hypothetical protein [Methylobacteriaceae bacterium]